MSAPIEVTVRVATTVETLTEAWAFVMDALDRDDVGPDPSITISPIWSWSVTEQFDEMPPRKFSVVVSGMRDDQGAEK